MRADEQCFEQAQAACLESCSLLLQVVERRLTEHPGEADTLTVYGWLARLALNLAISLGEDTETDWERCGLEQPAPDAELH